MTPADAARLREVYRRESRSLLRYVRGASPYTSLADRGVRDALFRVADESAAALDALGDYLERVRVDLPPLGSYPVAFTDLNFVAVRSLLPRVAAEQRLDLTALEADAAATTDPAARAAVGALADLHRRHSKELDALG